jgi:hypothetical protein
LARKRVGRAVTAGDLRDWKDWVGGERRVAAGLLSWRTSDDVHSGRFGLLSLGVAV